MNITRFRSAIRYLSWTDPFYKWRLSLSDCPNCDGKSIFINMKGSVQSLVDGPFMTRCIRCGSNVTNMACILVAEEHMRRHTVNDAYEMSTYGATLKYLTKNVRRVVTSEYYPGRTSGEIIGGILNEDVQSL